ncbi:MAG: glycosyltransferase family 2 protein [Blastocatellia bacterium]
MKLSVVIAASNGPSSLRRCLESLNEEAKEEEIEIITVSNYDLGADPSIETNYPHVKFISLPAGTTVPELRTRGIARSSGKIIALIEDHCLVDRQWSSEITRAHELPYPAIGGSVENQSCSHLLDWAVYFYDYGKYMPPNRAGAADALPGNNATYKRSALDQIQESYRDGFYETFVNEELKGRGETLYLAPAAIVYHRNSYELRKMLAQFHHHARAYAGKRAASAGLLKRLAMAAGSPALPAVLTTRIALRTLSKHRRQKELWLSLPYIFALMTSWASGEICGYLLGAGDSARHWK